MINHLSENKDIVEEEAEEVAEAAHMEAYII